MNEHPTYIQDMPFWVDGWEVVLITESPLADGNSSKNFASK